MTPSGSLLLWVSIQSGEARSITDTCWTRDWLGIYFGHTGPPSRSFSVKGETSHFSLGMSRKFARYKTPEIQKDHWITEGTKAPAHILQQQPGEINSHSLILFPPNGHKCWNAARTSGLCSFTLLPRRVMSIWFG